MMIKGKLPRIFFLLILVVGSIRHANSKELIFVQNLFRHGARYPISLNSDDNTLDPKIADNVGQLTTQGKNMQYLLGKALYARYWQKLFGNQTYCKNHYCHKNIYAKSTNVNRTIQSLECQLVGWFQNMQPLTLNETQRQFSFPSYQNLTDWIDVDYMSQGNSTKWNVFNQMPKYQPVPIHVGQGSQQIGSSNPYDQGDYLLKFSTLNCPNYAKWTQWSYESSQAKYIMQIPEIKQALVALQIQFPNQQITFNTSYRYVDNAVCLKYLGLPYNKIFDSSSSKYADTLYFIRIFHLYLSMSHLPIQRNTASTDLFAHTINNIKKSIKGTGPKLVLYSGHDTSVAVTLATLNLTNVKCIIENYIKGVDNADTCLYGYPQFSSSLVIEVYKEKQNTYVFQLVYQGQPRKIPFCDWKYSCNVQTLYKWYDSWKVKNPNQVCGIVDQYEAELVSEQTGIYKLLSVVIILAIVVLLLCVYVWWLKKKMSQLIDDKKQKKREEYMANFQQKQFESR